MVGASRPERQPLGRALTSLIRRPFGASIITHIKAVRLQDYSPSRTSTVRASIITSRRVGSVCRHRCGPNVNRSGKYHHLPVRSEVVVPNVNRSGKYPRRANDLDTPSRASSGKYPHKTTEQVHSLADASRTSTVRASIITVSLAADTLASRIAFSLVPNVNRSGKYHHLRRPVPNVNRSGKYHHFLPDRLNVKCHVVVPNVNRSGKYHHTYGRSTGAVTVGSPERPPLGQISSHARIASHVGAGACPERQPLGQVSSRCAGCARPLPVARPERQPFGQVSSQVRPLAELATSTRPEHQPFGQVSSHGDVARPRRGVAVVPNVNRSGKVSSPSMCHRPKSTLSRSRTSTVRASIITTRRLVVDDLEPLSRTSTVRASIITVKPEPVRNFRFDVPNVNRSGKYHHDVAAELDVLADDAPNVNRSGKYHHASWMLTSGRKSPSRTSTVRASIITWAAAAGC